MDPIISATIIRILNESEDFSFIYDNKSRSMEHGVKTHCFITRVQVEVRENHQLSPSDKDVLKTWRALRNKFVRLNKTMSEMKSPSVLSDNDKIFYRSLIFLEDFIEHKQGKVYKWEDLHPSDEKLDESDFAELRDALGEEVYHQLFPGEPDQYNLDEFPDASELFNANELLNTSESEEIEVLDEYQFLFTQKPVSQPIAAQKEPVLPMEVPLQEPISSDSLPSVEVIAHENAKVEENPVSPKQKHINVAAQQEPVLSIKVAQKEPVLPIEVVEQESISLDSLPSVEVIAHKNAKVEQNPTFDQNERAQRLNEISSVFHDLIMNLNDFHQRRIVFLQLMKAIKAFILSIQN